MRKPHIYGGEYQASKRTVRDTQEERDLGYGRLLDYHDSRDVQLFWQNSKMKDNGLFKLRVAGRGDQKAIDLWLDAEQVLQFLRWI